MGWSILYWLTVISILFALCVLIRSEYERGCLEVTKYEIVFDTLPKAFDGYKIIMLSDLHNKTFGKGNWRLIEKIERQAPDVIMVAGDMVTAKPGRSTEIPLKLMKDLSEKYKIYYANGNHEYRMKIYRKDYGTTYEEYRKALISCGVSVLENQKTQIRKNEDSIAVYGLEIDKKYYKRNEKLEMTGDEIEKVLGKKEEGEFAILIAHNPRYFAAYQRWGADLVFSGHLHGGIIRIPGIGGLISPQVDFFPEYDAGLFKSKTNLIIGRGLGTHTVNIRLFNKPEIISLTLKCGCKNLLEKKEKP